MIANFQSWREEARAVHRYDQITAAAEDWLARDLAVTEPGPPRISLALAEVLWWTRSAPTNARLVLLELPWSGPRCFKRHQATLKAAARQLRPCRHLAADPELLPSALEFYLTSGVAALLGHDLDNGSTMPEGRLLAQLTEFVLEPYLGSASAARFAQVGRAGAGRGSYPVGAGHPSSPGPSGTCLTRSAPASSKAFFDRADGGRWRGR